MKKKLLLTGMALCMLTSASAYAQIAVQIGAPPVYMAPAPVYVAPAPVVVAQPGVIVHPWLNSYDPHHRASDYRYWRTHRRDDHDHR